MPKNKDLRPPKLEVSVAAAVKLASILVHLDEYNSPGGSPLDLETARHMMEDADVKDLLGKFEDMALLPVRRDGKKYGR